MTFNQPMDTVSVEEAFVLVEQEGERPAGTFGWNDNHTVMWFTPDENLQLDGFYTAKIDARIARAANGTAQLTGTMLWNFTTVGRPRIVRTYPADGERDADTWGGFEITFATPMDQSTLADRITIDPAPPEDFGSYYYEYDNSFNLSFTREPSTWYTVTIEPGMADVYGNTIDEGLVVHFATQAYQASIDLTVPSRVGLYSAYAPQTRLFATHVNVSRLDLSLYQASLDDLARMSGPNSYEFEDSYQPSASNLLRRWTVPVASDLNSYRYDLLTITAEGGGTPVECPGAPEPRLEVGGTGIVLTDPDPLRVRDRVPDGEIIGLLYKDYQFPVQAGRCAPTACSGGRSCWGWHAGLGCRGRFRGILR